MYIHIVVNDNVLCMYDIYNNMCIYMHMYTCIVYCMISLISMGEGPVYVYNITITIYYNYISSEKKD